MQANPESPRGDFGNRGARSSCYRGGEPMRRGVNRYNRARVTR